MLGSHGLQAWGPRSPGHTPSSIWPLTPCPGGQDTALGWPSRAAPCQEGLYRASSTQGLPQH